MVITPITVLWQWIDSCWSFFPLILKYLKNNNDNTLSLELEKMKTRKRMNEKEMILHCKKMQNIAPLWMFHIQCYHFEAKSYKNNKNEWQTETFRVDTYNVCQPFIYQTFQDISNDINIHDLTKFQFIHLKSKKEIIFADKTTKFEFQRQKDLFIANHSKKDQYFEFAESIVVKCFFFMCPTFCFVSN